MMHVLYSFPLRFGLAGIGTTAWNQVAELVKKGLRVTLFCGSCERPVPGIHRVVETMRVGPIPIPYRLIGNARAFRFHDWKVAQEISRAAAKGDGGYDVVHCWPLGSLATLRAARRCGTASVLERPNTHTAFAYEAVAREHEKLGLPVDRSHSHSFNAERLRIEEAEYACADILACPSEFVAQTFLARGVEPARIGRHRYGYDPGRFSPGPAPDASRPLTLLFVGSCEPRKGLHYALEAWSRSSASSEGRFIICGSFVPGYRDKLAHLLSAPGVEDRGYLRDVSGVMREADALVLPSVEEGSALVTYEARACGCILLVSDATGAVVEDGRSGFVHHAGDVDTLSQQMSLLASDRGRLLAMRSSSIEGLPELTWATGCELLYGLYKRAIQQGKTRTS